MTQRKLANLIILLAIVLSSCAPAAVTSLPLTSPTASVPTVTPPPQATATAAATSTSVPTKDPNAPNDATQARLRVSLCIWGVPDMDIYLNDKVPVTAGIPMSLVATDVGRYEYLEPGTVRVAVGPAGKGIDQAFLTPVDVTLKAGHRYTVVILGQPEDKSHKALVIDETQAYEKAGATPGNARHISINNIKGTATLSMLTDGKGEKDVPYGGFAASASSTGEFQTFTVSVDNYIIENNGAGFNWQGSDTLDCWYGSSSSTNDTHDSHTSIMVTDLHMIDFLQGLTDEHAQGDHAPPQYGIFLAAVKTAGLADLLTTGGPYLLFAPTDEAFAAMPKQQLDALMADPAALAKFLKAYIVEGYYPADWMPEKNGSYALKLTNMLGDKLGIFVSNGFNNYYTINGAPMGLIDTAITANGNRVLFISNLIVAASK